MVGLLSVIKDTTNIKEEDYALYIKMQNLLMQIDYANAQNSKKEIAALKHSINEITNKYFDLSIQNDQLRRELNSVLQ